MDLVFGNLLKEIHIKVSGFKIANMEKEFSSTELVHIKETSKIS